MTEVQGPSRSLQNYASRFIRAPIGDGQSPGRVGGFCTLETRHWQRDFPALGRRLAAGLAPCLAESACCRSLRQFAWADRPGFDNRAPGLGPLAALARAFFSGQAKLFSAVMGPANCAGRSSPFPLPTWHWPLNWDEAEAAGVYLRSTGGQSLDAGGIHPRQLGFTSWAATYPRFLRRFVRGGAAAHHMIRTGSRLPWKLEPVAA